MSTNTRSIETAISFRYSHRVTSRCSTVQDYSYRERFYPIEVNHCAALWLCRPAVDPLSNLLRPRALEHIASDTHTKS
jgi:Zn-dependent M28 family amino/carboxypeptidase